MKHNSETAPWNRSWFYIDRDGRTTFFYLAFVHVLAIIGLILLPLPSLTVVLVSMLFAFLGALGATVVYHRVLTHRGVQFAPWAEQLFIFFAIFNGVGAPRAWVANHRYHHAMADTPNDLSSPHQGGFWWSHLRWLWQTKQTPPERYAPELSAFRYRFWDKAQIPILIFSGFIGLYWSPTAFLWFGPLRLIYSLHGQCAVNSVCHLGHPDQPPRGSSLNVWWLTPFFLGIGENWHSNHHFNQTNPRLGLTLRQVDMGWWTIQLLRKIGAAKLKRG